MTSAVYKEYLVVHNVDHGPKHGVRMPSKTFLGEFEQMILLAILQGGEDANAFEVRKELEASAGRTVTKGAFYTTLDRLERKKYLTWTNSCARISSSSYKNWSWRKTPSRSRLGTDTVPSLASS